MCGRFTLTQRLEALERIFKAKAKAALRLPRYNIAPTQAVALICSDDPQTIQEADWGFTVFPSDGSPPRLLVNAKAETLGDRPAYAQAFRSRRCLILADGFFEWETRAGKRYPRFFRLRNSRPFAFAGLYDEEGAKRHAVIITTGANDIVAPTHSRMPVMLKEPLRWLDGATPESLYDTLVPYAPELMEGFNVNPIVNSAENDSERCIEPYEPPELSLFLGYRS